MKRKIPFICFLFFTLPHQLLLAQSGIWTWMKGDSIPYGDGVFGTIGVPDSNNTPQAAMDALTWTDLDGNFWLFGGVDEFENSAFWKFDPLDNNWTWMGGSMTCCQAGTYGDNGIPSPSNYPGARGAGAGTWVDKMGNLWLYGGIGYDCNGEEVVLADLWKYDMQLNEWTWISGQDSGLGIINHGTKGIPADSNQPGSRAYTYGTWVDDSNRLWMFGGILYEANPYGWGWAGACNDMWLFDIDLNEWIWMSGSSELDDSGHYGLLGIPDTSNLPPARGVFSVWKNCNDDFFMFGGFNFSQFYNDLWKYNWHTKTFTWISGSSSSNSIGNYGGQCISDSHNVPSCHFWNEACWTDICGNLWFWGGLDDNLGAKNDLWVYQSSIGDWVWVSGDSTAESLGFYGQMGIGADVNVPPAKYGSSGWVDKFGNFWTWGGDNGALAQHNDLWKYTPAASCPNSLCVRPKANFFTSDQSFCEGTCIIFIDLSLGCIDQWEWLFPGGQPSIVYSSGPINICYDSQGSFDVMLVVSNSNGSDTLLLENYINVFPNPNAPSIVQQNNVLYSSPAANYQWFSNGNPIIGATNSSYTPLTEGYYYVAVTDSNGCSSLDSIYFNFTPESNLIATDSFICEKFCTNYFDQSLHNPTSWLWQFPGGTPPSSTDQNPINICYNEPGVYDVTLITTNANGSDTLTLHNYITVYPTPPIPTITQIGFTLTSSEADFYQWQLNAVDIPGATNQSYEVLQTGFYTVVISDSNSCVNSTTLYVEITGIDEVSDAGISVYPNPSDGIFTISFGNTIPASEVTLQVTDAIGRSVYFHTTDHELQSPILQMDLHQLPRGVYFLTIRSSGFPMMKKIIIG